MPPPVTNKQPDIDTLVAHNVIEKKKKKKAQGSCQPIQDIDSLYSRNGPHVARGQFESKNISKHDACAWEVISFGGGNGKKQERNACKNTPSLEK